MPAAIAMKSLHEWDSPHLGHKMSLSVFGRSGTRVLMFPIRVTSYAMYERHGVVGALERFWSEGTLQLYCVDAVDDFSYDSRRRLEILDAQERYVLEELLPFSEELNPGSDVATFGICMGGFHAVDLTFRNLGTFSRAVALSSRFDLTRDFPGHEALLSRAGGKVAFWHTPAAYLPRLKDELSDCGVHVVLGVGQRDPFLESNLELYRILRTSGVQVELHTWDGPARRGYYWRTMVPHCFGTPSPDKRS